MTDISKIYYSKKPNNLYQLSRSITKKLNNKKDLVIPDISAELCSVKVSKKQISNYRNICAYKGNTEYIPAIFPHILAFPLHMELLLHPKFPRTPIGSVHLRNSINQFRPIGLHEKLDIRVSFSNSIEVDHGVEFDIETRIYTYGELVWSSESTILLRNNTKKIIKSTKKNTIGNTSKIIEDSHMSDLVLPNNWGVKYGLISGDLNPIHLHPWLAKLFGFEHHIAHGMASAATIFSILNQQLELDSFIYSVNFKHPISLPNSVNLHHKTATDKNSIYFEAFTKPDSKEKNQEIINPRPKIIGSLRDIS